MTIQVTGILPTPMGEPASNIIIRVFATDTSSDSVPLLPSIITTGSDGNYDFTLGNGTYSIEVNFNNRYNLIKEVIVTDVTTTPITLPNLLN